MFRLVEFLMSEGIRLVGHRARGTRSRLTGRLSSLRRTLRLWRASTPGRGKPKQQPQCGRACPRDAGFHTPFQCNPLLAGCHRPVRLSERLDSASRAAIHPLGSGPSDSTLRPSAFWGSSDRAPAPHLHLGIGLCRAAGPKASGLWCPHALPFDLGRNSGADLVVRAVGSGIGPTSILRSLPGLTFPVARIQASPDWAKQYSQRSLWPGEGPSRDREPGRRALWRVVRTRETLRLSCWSPAFSFRQIRS